MFGEFFRKKRVKKAKQILNLDKNSKIEILDDTKTELGSGYYGTAIQHQIDLKNITQPNYKTKSRDFVVKKFNHKKDCHNSYLTYLKLKQFNLPTFTTYRMVSENEIIMTNLSKPNQFCVNPINERSSDSEYLIYNQGIYDIEHFDKFLNNAIELIKQISNLNIKISQDVFFLIGEVKHSTNVSIVLGDFDRIVFNSKNSFQNNLFCMEMVLIKFVTLYLNPANSENYRKLIKQKFSQFNFLNKK